MTQVAIEVNGQPKLVRRKQLAALTGVRASTIMYYSQEGLLPFHQQGVGLARRYALDEVRLRLAEIDALQAGGLSIEQIKGRLAGRVDDTEPAATNAGL